MINLTSEYIIILQYWTKYQTRDMCKKAADLISALSRYTIVDRISVCV